ncbi:MAG TPA: DNA mismatch repair endonuclease MutL [Firmicutes bacterium]|jgi:DNA mismatch repair protein MutL|nr:DNA mismatch repair endonuclease MutL [Bacillota bacterium]
MANKIYILDESTINQIAAGEVIERPAMVLKELLENAIDAGAEKIEIHLANGGRQKIQAIDDGEGMDREDALLALERHATSKIRVLDDLYRSSYLGFRGEALPSIAAVSRLTLQTAKTAGVPGTRIVVEGGKIITCEEVGAPKGTSVTVENLFYNTPARLKFLKSIPAELTQIKETVTGIALGYPEIAFHLSHQGSELISTVKGSSLENRIKQVFNPEISRQLVPVQGSYGPLRIKGFAGRPPIARANRMQQYFFLNRRVFRSRLIASAAEKAYGTLLPVARFPFLLLYLELPLDQVDINVHPNKMEVRFSDEKEIYRGVFHILKDCLQTELVAKAWTPGYRFHHRQVEAGSKREEDGTGLKTTVPWKSGQRETAAFAFPETENAETLQVAEGKKDPTGAGSIFSKDPGLHSPGVFCLFGTYLFFEEGDRVVIIDQHAAHERVIYDQLQKKKGQCGQAFLTPVPVELTDEQLKTAEKQRELLLELGFEFDLFSGRTVLLRCAPLGFSSSEGEDLFLSLLAEWSGGSEARRDYMERALSLIACKRAVKAGDSLTLDEAAGLLRDLRKTVLPQTCPHGRPTMVVLERAEIERMFKRR